MAGRSAKASPSGDVIACRRNLRVWLDRLAGRGHGGDEEMRVGERNRPTYTQDPPPQLCRFTPRLLRQGVNLPPRGQLTPIEDLRQHFVAFELAGCGSIAKA